MPPLLELENVTKTFGPHNALGPIDLAVPEGSVGLLGPNGAGKSTLIRLMLGLIPPTTGTIRVLGHEVQAGNADVLRHVGYVPEGESVFPGLTGVEATAYAGELSGMRRVDALKRAHEVLDYVQLGEERYRFGDSYSTGMKQRLKLAQALVHDPQLLILDEPTEGVDPQARIHLLDLIHALAEEHQIRILLSTHILPDVERIASHVLVLNQGRVAAHGSLDTLRQAATKSYVVRVAGGRVDKLTERLKAEGIGFEHAEPNLRVDVEDPREVIRHVKASGLTIRHLAPASLSLEEAFEQALGGNPHG